MTVAEFEDQLRTIEHQWNESQRGMSAKDVVLLATMPLWLGAIILGSVFLVSAGLPIMIYGPLYLFGKIMNEPNGASVIASFGGLILGLAALRVYKSYQPKPREFNSLSLCSRCSSTNTRNMVGGKVSCMTCGYIM